MFVFTKTLKTAGTSVELFLEPFCAPEDHQVQRMTEAVESAVGIVGARGTRSAIKAEKWYNHMPAELIRSQLGETLWNAYYKFTIVRNPYDKVVSWFHFDHLKESDALPFAEIKQHFRRFVLECDVLAVMDRDKYVIDGSVCVDRFIRYEMLDDDLKDLADHLGLDIAGRDLMHAKGHFRPKGLKFQDYYDKDTAAVVARAFDFELETFGYRL